MKNHKIIKRNVYGPDGKIVPSRKGKNDSIFVTETYTVEFEAEIFREMTSIGGHVEYLEWVSEHAINFLTIRGIPSKLTYYDADGNTSKNRGEIKGTSYDLKGYVTAKYGHIPAVIKAAELISLTHRFSQLEEGNVARKFDILADTSMKLRHLTIAHMEAYWLAGKSRTGEASKVRSETKAELIKTVKPWLDEYISDGKTKSNAYRLISKRLHELGFIKSESTIKGWFYGR
jgi:hypothetical protein